MLIRDLKVCKKVHIFYLSCCTTPKALISQTWNLDTHCIKGWSSYIHNLKVTFSSGSTRSTWEGMPTCFETGKPLLGFGNCKISTSVENCQISTSIENCQISTRVENCQISTRVKICQISTRVEKRQKSTRDENCKVFIAFSLRVEIWTWNWWNKKQHASNNHHTFKKSLK